MEYKVVSAENIDKLQRLVNESIREGWQPLGGVCAWTNGALLLQAMTRQRKNL
jgi:hypothetical protein